MTARTAGLRTFGQESRDAEARAGRGYVITGDQARRARVAAARFCLARGLGRDDWDELVGLLGVRA